MTRTGMVLAFFNVLLALAFLAFAAPVAENRRDKQKAIKAEDEKVPAFIKDAQTGDREQWAERRRLVRLQNVKAEENARAANEQLRLRARTTVLQDELNDNNDRKANLSGSITQVESEIAAREAELKGLGEEVEQAKASMTKLNQENAQYQAKLDAATKQYDTLVARIGANFAAVQKLLERVPAVPADEVARFGERP